MICTLVQHLKFHLLFSFPEPSTREEERKHGSDRQRHDRCPDDDRILKMNWQRPKNRHLSWPDVCCPKPNLEGKPTHQRDAWSAYLPSEDESNRQTQSSQKNGRL